MCLPPSKPPRLLPPHPEAEHGKTTGLQPCTSATFSASPSPRSRLSSFLREAIRPGRISTKRSATWNRCSLPLSRSPTARAEPPANSLTTSCCGSGRPPRSLPYRTSPASAIPEKRSARSSNATPQPAFPMYSPCAATRPRISRTTIGQKAISATRPISLPSSASSTARALILIHAVSASVWPASPKVIPPRRIACSSLSTSRPRSTPAPTTSARNCFSTTTIFSISATAASLSASMCRSSPASCPSPPCRA